MARGRPPAYSRDQVVEAAIRIADAEGLPAVTMRRVATEIGAGAMSLYTYVPTRERLLEAANDINEYTGRVINLFRRIYLEKGLEKPE